jgi:hypothetical protein
MMILILIGGDTKRSPHVYQSMDRSKVQQGLLSL